jgi:hypothetical protein
MKRFIFYALDQYTLKVYRRQEWEAGVKHGIKCEQQRIINLIKPFTVCDNDCDHYGCTTFVAEQIIALIKGEK